MNSLSFIFSIFFICFCLIVFEGKETFAYTDDNEEGNETMNQNGSHTKNGIDYDNELKSKREELRQKRERTVKKVLSANSSDKCGFLSNPWEALNGKICGAHYKVLQLNRFGDDLDKTAVKKAFRHLSLSLHPDKNPSPDASTAFKIVQNAYECLSDDICKEDYDAYLQRQEDMILAERTKLKQVAVEKAIQYGTVAHRYATKASDWIIDAAQRVWSVADDLTVTMYDTEIPLGKILVSMVAVWKLKLSATIATFAILVSKLNKELVKDRQRRFGL